MLVDSLHARSVVARLNRAKETVQEMIERSAPALSISLARMNVTALQAEVDALPRSNEAA